MRTTRMTSARNIIRTKIVATMGPAVAKEETLVSLLKAGVDVCRLNFSHGTLDEHATMLRAIRAAAAKVDHPVAILGDLCGPKIRLGQVADENGAGGMPIEVGDELIIQRQPIIGRDKRVSTIVPTFVDDVQVGARILIEDGMLRFVCIDKSADELRCQCTIGGVLKSAKGINLPGTHLNVSAITERDWECVDWAIRNDLDFLALSFVRKADEIRLLRENLRNHAAPISIIAKIEKSEAVDDIDAILEASDGLMIARGDLGVEMDVAQVPIIQKDLIRRCQVAGKPVIVATQMLQSMIEHASPTRAEVSDVANAIFDGTDAVMLSGETSVGKYPVGSVLVMNHVAATTEKYLDTVTATREPPVRVRSLQLSQAVARGVWQIVQDLRVKAVVIWSQNGASARVFSKQRLPVPIVALSSDDRALRQMAINYGVIPQKMSVPRSMDALIENIDRILRDTGRAEAGDRIVIVAGSSLDTSGTVNSVILHAVGEGWTAAPAHVTMSSEGGYE